jgi:hypothetical protein
LALVAQRQAAGRFPEQTAEARCLAQLLPLVAVMAGMMPEVALLLAIPVAQAGVAPLTTEVLDLELLVKEMPVVLGVAQDAVAEVVLAALLNHFLLAIQILGGKAAQGLSPVLQDLQFNTLAAAVAHLRIPLV